MILRTLFLVVSVAVEATAFIPRSSYIIDTAPAVRARQSAVNSLSLEMKNDNGDFSMTGETHRREILHAGFVAGLASLGLAPSMAQAEGDDANTTLHIVDYPTPGLCGETKTTEKKAYFAKTFGGLKDGACAVEGYTKAEGSANGTNDKDQDKLYSLFGKE